MKRFLSILAAFLPAIALAALPSTGIINIQSTATAGNVNGGGFNAARGGTNYSLQNAAQLHLTNFTTLALGATTITTVTGGSFTSGMVGNYIHINSGTNFTAGWYEIVTFTDANNVILDRSPTPAAAGTLGDGYVGGAMSLVSTLDDDLFEIGVTGNIFYVKAGSYTLGETVTIAATGTAADPIRMRGYTTTQGDSVGNSRPVFTCGSSAFTFPSAWGVHGMEIRSTNGVTAALTAPVIVDNCKVINSGTGSVIGINPVGSNMIVMNSEVICYRGKAIQLSAANCSVVRCIIHDSDIGIALGLGSNSGAIQENVIHSCKTGSIVTNVAAGQTGRMVIQRNTLFGSTNTTGIGLSLVTGTTNIAFLQNIVTGFVTGVSNADTSTSNVDDFNDYYNNDADVSAAGQWQKGANDAAVNPSFANVGQITGATATTTSGNHLVQSGATFITSGVVAGQHYVCIISGTGVTAGIYGIASVDSETQITTDITLTANATADKVWQITTGFDFNPGSLMKGLGGRSFAGGFTTDYSDQGAAQRREVDGGGASVFIQ